MAKETRTSTRKAPARQPVPSRRSSTQSRAATSSRPSQNRSQSRPRRQNQPQSSNRSRSQGGRTQTQRRPNPSTSQQRTTQSSQGQRMQPQKQNVTQRPLAPGRTGRARSMHLRKIVKRKERRARLSKIFAVVLSVVCGVFALTTFFQIDEIRIEGMSRYQEEDVLATFGVKQGDNLFFCDSWRGKRRLLSQYHYFDSVTIERDLPNQMVIEVVESQPIAVVSGTQGGWFVLDKNCRVLARTDQTGARDIAEVMGLRTEGAEPGQTLTAEDNNVLEALKTLANGLDEAGMGGKATLYNLQDLNNIWFQYENRFAVCVGNLEQLEHKLAILYALVTGEQFTPSDKGSINLALGDRAITNTSLSASEVEKMVRGQIGIERIADPNRDDQTDSQEEDGNSE